MLYQDEKNHDLAKAAAAASSINASATSEATASVVVEASYYEALTLVGELALSRAEKNALEELMQCVHEAEKDESLARRALKGLIDKAFDLGVDAVKAVIPYAWGVLMALSGSA